MNKQVNYCKCNCFANEGSLIKIGEQITNNNANNKRSIFNYAATLLRLKLCSMLNIER